MVGVSTKGDVPMTLWDKPTSFAFDSLDETLSAAAGLPGPSGDLLAHYSPGVSVDIFAPERVD